MERDGNADHYNTQMDTMNERARSLRSRCFSLDGPNRFYFGKKATARRFRGNYRVLRVIFANIDNRPWSLCLRQSIGGCLVWATALKLEFYWGPPR